MSLVKTLTPTKITPYVKYVAIASLISQMMLVATGGLVRLTGSGLGCPSWPKCTPGSLVNTPAMGIHGVIEFTNRTLTGVLSVIAVMMVAAVWRYRAERKDLWILSILLLLGIPAQAVVGGITVLTDLNPWVVGFHFFVSITMISLATLLVNRVYNGPRVSSALAEFPRGVLISIGIFGITAIILGVFVTGSGPHAGDANAPRNGLDPLWITRFHSASVWILIALTVYGFMMIRQFPQLRKIEKPMMWLVMAEIIQAGIGYTQHLMGLPGALVELHMIGAAILTVAITYVIDEGVTYDYSK
ncbi:MAG: COX15/CtaA family protein [Micrococcaceae bacterium]